MAMGAIVLAALLSRASAATALFAASGPHPMRGAAHAVDEGQSATSGATSGATKASVPGLARSGGDLLAGMPDGEQQSSGDDCAIEQQSPFVQEDRLYSRRSRERALPAARRACEAHRSRGPPVGT